MPCQTVEYTSPKALISFSHEVLVRSYQFCFRTRAWDKVPTTLWSRVTVGVIRLKVDFWVPNFDLDFDSSTFNIAVFRTEREQKLLQFCLGTLIGNQSCLIIMGLWFHVNWEQVYWIFFTFNDTGLLCRHYNIPPCSATMQSSSPLLPLSAAIYLPVDKKSTFKKSINVI